jgi:P27 family predicted phage terminase small subunit
LKQPKLENIMTGRRPKPTYLKVIEGNPGKRPLNKREPKPRGALRHAPAWFDARQKRMWEQVIAQAPNGLLKHVDRAVVEVFVVASITHEDATVELRRTGLVTGTGVGTVKENPLLRAQRTAAQTMLRAAAEMGFTPSSRSRVTVVPDFEDDEDGSKDSPFAPFKSKD